MESVAAAILGVIESAGFEVATVHGPGDALALVATETASGRTWVVRGEDADAYALVVELASRVGVELQD